MIEAAIKYFAMVFVSLYSYERLLGVEHIKIYMKILNILFSVPMVIIIRKCFPPITVCCMILLMMFFYNVMTNQKLRINIATSILSTSIAYILYAFSMIVSIPISSLEYILINNTGLAYLLDICFVVTIAIVQLLFCFLLFKIRRFRKGVPHILQKISSDIGLFIGIIVVFLFSILFFRFEEKIITNIYMIVALFVCLLGFIAYLWWCKRITNDYLNKVQQRNLDTAEQTIARQKEEIEYLSKIVHKDNKLIGALELSLQEAEGVDKDRLFAMSKERDSLLHTYKESEEMMQKTGVFSIDMMINYLLKRAFEQDATFEVVVTGNINYMIQNVIDEEDLSTLLADIGENAVIAVSSGERRNILLSIGVRENSYYIDVYDSGIPFDVNVIENYGRTRYTTHKTTGGSGIGLMQTKELLSKYKASFEIEEIENNSLYTKRVSVVFDSLSQTRIFTNRPEILELRTQRDDIIFSEITVNK